MDDIVHASVLPQMRPQRHFARASREIVRWHRAHQRVGSTDSTSASQRPGDAGHVIVPVAGWKLRTL
jgi:hypothetical protein